MADNNPREDIRRANLEKNADQKAIDDQVQKFQRALDSVPDERSKSTLANERPELVIKLLESKGFKNPSDILEAREYWRRYKDVSAEKEAGLPDATSGAEDLGAASSVKQLGGAAAIGAAAGVAGTYEHLKNREYNNLIKEAEKASNEIAKSWKENPDPEYAKSEQGARNRAVNEYYDERLAENPSQIAKLARQYNNLDMQKAIKRNEILENPNPRRSTALSQKRRGRRRGAGGVAKNAGKGAAKRGAAFLAANWEIVAVGLAVVGFLVLIIWLFLTIKGACDNFWDDPIGNAPLVAIGNATGICNVIYEVDYPENPPGVTTEKEGPSAVPNGESLAYTIKVTYDPTVLNAPPLEDLYLFDAPLFDHEFVSSTGNPETTTDDDGNKYYSWKLSDFIDDSGGDSSSTIFLLTIDPIVTDFVAVNASYVSTQFYPVYIVYNEDDVVSSAPTVSSGAGVKPCGSRSQNDIWYGADCLPTDDYCDNNKYRPRIDQTMDWILKGINKDGVKVATFNENPAGSGGNFGDPLCSYRLPKANAIIDELEQNQQRADFWKEIVRCEGGVNSYGYQIHDDTKRPNGPAGMFQMNIGDPIFKRWNPNNPKRGDVPWQRQIQNAIAKNNDDRENDNDFGFWGSAMCLCWWPEHRDKGYCADIRAKGLNNDYGPRAPLEDCPPNTGWKCQTAYRCENFSCRPQ